MLLIQDVHVVMGREELPFEDTYRSSYAPRVAEDPGARLAAFLWAPHGSGEGFEAVTLTALADIDAVGRLQDRTATGDLADVWLELEGKQRSVHSSLHDVAAWSPLATGALDAFEVADPALSLYRLDAFVVAGGLEQASASVEAQWRSRRADDAVSTVACWLPYLGALERPIVHVLSRVRSEEALKAAFAHPASRWSGAPELPGARRVTRMLRSASWSPLQ